MNDKNIMENLLHAAKDTCDLYLHGTVESTTLDVHAAFAKALNKGLCMQNGLYLQMQRMGWDQSQDAPRQNIQQIKQKFPSVC
jgi:spore coat protein CotF